MAAPLAGGAVVAIALVADGSRFLMIKASGERSAEPNQLVVVLNWLEELKRLVPAR